MNAKKFPWVAGVDEVGRGTLVGAVVAAAVILHPERPITGLADSKKLTAKRREYLAAQIKEHAFAWALGRAEVVEIDELNIFHASLLAMKRAVEALNVLPELALIDGKFCPELLCPAQAIIAGDSSEPAISAASILAKVSRDAEMCVLAEKYPAYGFEQHKGYATAQHLAALQQYGATPEHRRSFAPVKACLVQTSLNL